MMQTESGVRPCIAGTGTSVKNIAGWCKSGVAPEEMLSKYPHLTLAQIYAALAYYHANREEIDAAQSEDERAGDALAAVARPRST